LQLSLNLRAIVCQRLVPALDGKRLPAVEILIDTPRVKDLIKKGEIDLLKEAMEQGEHEGNQTFDQSLFDLYWAGKVDLDQALGYADSVNNLRLRIKLAESQRGVDKPADDGAFRIKEGSPGAKPKPWGFGS